MKKLTLLFALILGFGLTSIQAQSHCDKKASKACKMECKDMKQADAGSAEAAAKLASLDENIEGKECKESGMVCYTRKVVSADGEVTHEVVSYSASTNGFVAMSSDSGNAGGGDKKSSCAGSGSGESASANAGKASAKASGSSCCSKKSGKSAKTSMKQTHAVDKKSSK